MKITGFYLKDHRLIQEDGCCLKLESFPRLLLDAARGQMTGREIRVMNFMTRWHGMYRILVLVRRPGMAADVYESMGCYRVMLHPATAFRVQMTMNGDGVPQARVMIRGIEFLFQGFYPVRLVTVSGKYPYTRTICREDLERDREDFLASQFEKLPFLVGFVRDFIAMAEKKLEQSSAPMILREYLQRHDLKAKDGENFHAYFSRLFNLLTSTQFNLCNAGLISLDESYEVSSFINHTILEGRVFE